jgi:hypothetical protein
MQANEDWAARISARIDQKKAQWVDTSIGKKMVEKKDVIASNYHVS